jgi:hypothetical protein
MVVLVKLAQQINQPKTFVAACSGQDRATAQGKVFTHPSLLFGRDSIYRTLKSIS